METDITVLTDLKPDGTFWSQRGEVDDKTDKIFAELMETYSKSRWKDDLVYSY